MQKTCVEDVRSKFNEQIKQFYESQQAVCNQKKPWTRERVLEVIINVKSSKEAMDRGVRRTPMQYYWAAKYDVLRIDNEDYLILKNSKPESPIRIIAIEDYFDLLFAVHNETGHGGRDKILKSIKNKFYIQKKPIEIFISLCPTCKIKRSTPKKSGMVKQTVSRDFNSRGHIDIIDFQTIQDGDYKWLLNYEDYATKFIQLRPLVTKQPTEIALELVKIFLTFGAPDVLESDNDLKFTAAIVAEVIKIWPEIKMVHGSPKHPSENPSDDEQSYGDVADMIRAWMRYKNSPKWTIGCHFVQFERNTSYRKSIDRSPYSALFGRDPKIFTDSYPST